MAMEKLKSILCLREKYDVSSYILFRTRDIKNTTLSEAQGQGGTWPVCHDTREMFSVVSISRCLFVHCAQQSSQGLEWSQTTANTQKAAQAVE